MNDNKPSGVGIAVGVLGALAAVGAAVAASKPKPSLRGVRPSIRIKKPCGCGR